MVFWIGILVSGIFVWYAVKIGFYEAWVLLFNILISIYLAIFLGPVLAEAIPGAGDTQYSNALAVFAVAVISFLILYGISYVFFIGQFKISFPRVLDIVGAGLWGFLAGFLVFSFVCLVICITPVSQGAIVGEIGFDGQVQQTNVSYICWWCDLVHTFAARIDNYRTPKQVISSLVRDVEKKAQAEAVKQGDKPDETAEPNTPAGNQ